MNGLIISRSLRYKRSGTTMQKLPLGHHGLQSANARRLVFDAYPWQGTFACEEEVRAYLDQPEITCLLCGKPFKQLPFHLKKIHFIDAIDYRKKYAIPQFAALDGLETRNLKSRNAAEQGLGVKFRGGTSGLKCRNRRHDLPEWLRAKLDEIRKYNPTLRKGGRAKAGIDYTNLEWHFAKFAEVRDYRREPVPTGLPHWDYFADICFRDEVLKQRRLRIRAQRIAAGWPPGCAA